MTSKSATNGTTSPIRQISSYELTVSDLLKYHRPEDEPLPEKQTKAGSTERVVDEHKVSNALLIVLAVRAAIRSKKPVVTYRHSGASCTANMYESKMMIVDRRYFPDLTPKDFIVTHGSHAAVKPSIRESICKKLTAKAI